jgi:hypothetical protein
MDHRAGVTIAGLSSPAASARVAVRMREALAGLALPAVVALAWSGVAALIFGLLLLAVPLSGQVADIVRPRSRELRDVVLRRLDQLGPLRTDEIIDTQTHDQFATVGSFLAGYRPPDGEVGEELERLRQATLRTVARLGASAADRDSLNERGVPILVGGLTTTPDTEDAVKLYGDPANVPDWVSRPVLRDALTGVGRVLDDVRHLHSSQIEWIVLTFTLYARALLLMLTPALGPLTSATTPTLAHLALGDLPWVLACAAAIGTAVTAPLIATAVMEPSPSGARIRRWLLAVELPLACALALTCPAWTAVAFSAGWTNWWQRIGRGRSDELAIPDFSWPRLGVWIAAVVGCQAAGFLLDASDPAAWRAAVEIAATLLVIGVIGGSYGAMFPLSAGMLARVIARGLRSQQRADREAEEVIGEIAMRMTRAADALERTPGEDRRKAEAIELLRRSERAILADRRHAIRRGAPRTLDAVVIAALAEGGHYMWAADPRALSRRDRAEREGEPLPVVVQRPAFEPGEDAFASIRLPKDVVDTLRRLIVACIVEARVHGTRRVETLVRRDGERVEIRIANEPREVAVHRGHGRGGKRIAALARALPGGEDPFRGDTTRAFLDRPGSLALFGVGFSFRVGPES